MSIHTYKKRILEALDQPQVYKILEKIVLEMSKNGFKKQIIYDLFTQIHLDHLNEDKTDPLLEVLDRLTGWCIAKAILLPNETIKE